MVIVIDRAETKQEIEILQTENWELPICNLGKGKYEWRPKTAFLPYYLFEGPKLTQRMHGLNLEKDLLIGIHGPRGSTKTLTASYLLGKKMRMGQPVWANWPISFFVIEPDCWDVCDRHDLCATCKVGHKSYYENMPLNMDKLYTFNSELEDGAVGMTELQYYAEARTSGRGQNRFITYQIMQIRKSALSFNYDVQNPEWADKRFAWSDDVKIFCKDVSKMNYDFASIEHEIQEGEYSHWKIRDMSGVLTGIEYKESGIEYGPYQFDGYHFWKIYPTKWKIDVYDAVYSMKQQSEKADMDAKIGEAINLAINSFLEENKTKVQGTDMWARATILGGITVPPKRGGEILGAYGIPSQRKSKGMEYDLSVVLPEDAGEAK